MTLIVPLIFVLVLHIFIRRGIRDTVKKSKFVFISNVVFLALLIWMAWQAQANFNARSQAIEKGESK
ncbi:MAG: hypothetical protein MUF05_04255 [Candidatus Omnitrophica bacterium]|jgi:hypothetical protein|nr:hypothetical protein [Candidatus Omnitrophota bacterium]